MTQSGVLDGDIARRIRQAREAQSVDQEELGRRVGMTRTNVSRLETGKRAIKVPELIAIAEALKLPLGWFLEERETLVPSRRTALLAGTGADFDAQLETISFHVRRLMGKGILAPLPFTTIQGVREGFDAQRIASTVRARAGLDAGPIANLTAVCESLGLLAFALPFEDSPFDGAMAKIEAAQEGTGLGVALIDASQPSGRMRFSLAHELGHWLLGDAFSECQRGGEQERLVNSFAAYLLMPKGYVVKRWEECQREFSEFDSAAHISAECGTSWSATLVHLVELGLLPVEMKLQLETRTPTKGDFGALGIELPLVKNLTEVPPQYKKQVLTAFKERALTTGASVEALLGTLTEDELPTRNPRQRSPLYEAATKELFG